MRSAIDELDRFLRSKLGSSKRPGPASMTCYVEDPYWHAEYRIVCMPGVKVREPMHGFVWINPHSRSFISTGAKEFFGSVEELAGDSAEDNAFLDAIPLDRRWLFARFSEREGVREIARFKDKEDNPRIILFVNYVELRIDDAEKQQLRTIWHSVQEAIPAIEAELLQRDALALAQAIRIMQPAQALAHQSFDSKDGEDRQMRARFEEILERSLEALGISVDEGFGTIHLYDSDTGYANLKAQFPNNIPFKEAERQYVTEGNGIVSWAILKQDAILIEDFERSEFDGVRVVIDDKVRSELAVPMIANGELVGVLNLECRRARAFASESVRAIWLAAETAASAYQLFRRSDALKSLMEIISRAIRGGQDTAESLKQLADQLRRAMRADYADIWHLNQLRTLSAAGFSYPPSQGSIRHDGWTHFIQRRGNAIWISDGSPTQRESDASPAASTVHEWVDGKWQEITEAKAPASINPNSRKLRVIAEFGLPIRLAGNCVGVVWLKYKTHRPPPRTDQIAEASFLVSQAGIVLEAIERQKEIPGAKDLNRIAGKLEEYWRDEELRFGEHSPADGYVVHESVHERACGDFHAVSIVNESTVGVLVGDGEGKSFTGLLNALPLIAGFNAFGRESGSSRFLMDRLMTISTEIGLIGTALYLTLTRIDDATYLSTTSAGHPQLILLKAYTWNVERFPDEGSPALGRPLGMQLPRDLRLRRPLGEDQIRLACDDLLVAYSDGISDVLSESPKAFDETIAEIVRPVAREPCERIARAILRRAQEAESSLPSDDKTVCVIRVRG